MAAKENPGDLRMSEFTLEMEHNRELLSQAIVDILRSWPELHRSVFVQAHYQGRPIEKISGYLGLSAPDVHRILDGCERKLRSALRNYRGSSHGVLAQSGPAHAPVPLNGCSF
jgi:DNA-directed RNA polymerase specialized sigma24 family protein